MPRIFRFVALLALVACPFCAQDPNDLSLALRLLKDQYAVNEPILFEVSLSTSTQRKYYANWTSLIPFGGPHILLEPHNSAVDLPAMQQIYAGSVLGSSGYLTATPVVETGDLTYWYRFEKAGHFRLSLAVDWVSRLKNADEGGGKEPIALQSNAVEFDILPPDPNRQAQELDSVLNDIDHSANTQFQPAALHRLELIQTPAAAQEEVRRYLASSHDYSPYSGILRMSSQLDQIISLLEAALANPALDPPLGIVDLLANLQVRKQMGNPPASLADLAERTRFQEKLFAQYSETLLNTIRLRSGPEQLDAEFQAWSNAERRYERTDPAPELLTDLRAQVLRIAGNLYPAQQSQFLTMEWDKLPHAELLPLIKRIAMPNSPGQWSRDWAFKFWCEDWQRDCAEAILSEAKQSGSNLPIGTILLIPESEHPELDLILRKKLADPNLERSPGGGSSTAALIMRAASKNLQPIVDAFLDNRLTLQFRNCDLDSYLTGYLLRVSPADAIKRLGRAFEDPKPDYCGSQMLRALSNAGRLEAAIPLVIAALNSPNLETASSAALLLAEHGPPSARAALSERLAELHAQWHDHAAEISSTGARLEESLVSALAHAQQWKLSTDEEQSLAAGCLTDQCRQIAAGRSWLSL